MPRGPSPDWAATFWADKNTPAVARMREAVAGSSLFSPFPFHSVYSVEDHKKHVDWIKEISPQALVSVKVSTPTDVDMVSVGSYYAGAHVIHIDGSYGGTGAAPDIAKKNIAMPIEYAIPKVHRFLVEEGAREKITLIASGGARSAVDIAKAIALGADGVVIGTADLVALECIRCNRCESGRGCVRGIATTDPGLSVMYDIEWGLPAAHQSIYGLVRAAPAYPGPDGARVHLRTGGPDRPAGPRGLLDPGNPPARRDALARPGQVRQGGGQMSSRRYDYSLLHHARADLIPARGKGLTDPVAEGGCGVTGFACSVPVAGKYIFEPSRQMHNRGNGKGGGIAMVGLEPAALGVDAETLASHYLLVVAYLEPDCRAELEGAFITPPL